ncbi:MAG: LCCL domain-containing protein [Gemmatimonadota bacterium]
MQSFRSLALAGLAVVAVVAPLGAQAAPAAQPPAPADTLTVDWEYRANMYEGLKPGTTILVVCPPTEVTEFGTLWGTDVYTDDSAVCPAAAHAGLVDFDRGGTVVLEYLPGQESYAGSARHGVTTTEYGPWSGSFRFVVPDEEEPAG